MHSSLRQRLAHQEIILLEGALRFTGPHAVTGHSSQPGKTNRISSYTCPYSTGDWNDGMNQVGQGVKGESVWLGWL